MYQNRTVEIFAVGLGRVSARSVPYSETSLSDAGKPEPTEPGYYFIAEGAPEATGPFSSFAECATAERKSF